MEDYKKPEIIQTGNVNLNTVDEQTAYDIVKKLADWSLKYPRGRIYGMSQKKMDDELIEIENEAKAFITKMSELVIGKKVKVNYPFPLDNEIFTIIGERKTQYEIEGDFSAGTNNVCQSEWVEKSMVKEWI